MNKKLKFFSCIVFLTIFTVNIDAAEGGPCKDYGDCDEFNYSLNDIESLKEKVIRISKKDHPLPKENSFTSKKMIKETINLYHQLLSKEV